MAKVYVTASETSHGKGMREFARDLAEKLGWPLEKVRPKDLKSVPMERGGILVFRKRIRDDVTILIPRKEATLFGRSFGSMLVPFGSGESGIHAARSVLPICEKLGLNIVFYHTSWSKDGIRSSHTWDHMSDEAKAVARCLKALADGADVECEFVLERVPTIRNGIVENSHRFGCSLTAVCESPGIRKGTNVINTVKLSTTPILIVGKQEIEGDPVEICSEACAASDDDAKRPDWACNDANTSFKREEEPQSRRSMIMNFVFSPIGTTILVLLMYGVKSYLQIRFGGEMDSPVITGNGYHNIGDMMEEGGILMVIFLSVVAIGRRFPWGLKKLEEVATAAIGLALTWTGIKFLMGAVIGLVAWLPENLSVTQDYAIALTVFSVFILAMIFALWKRMNTIAFVVMFIFFALSGSLAATAIPWVSEYFRLDTMPTTDEHFWLLCGMLCVFVAASFFVSRHQIAVGRKHKRPVVVASGHETRSDAWIEIGILAGVILVTLSSEPRVEYIAAFLVALKLGWTGFHDLFLDSAFSLIGSSIGDELEDKIEKKVMSFRGVDQVAELKTFKVGANAYVILKFFSGARVRAQECLKKVLEEQIAELLDKESLGVEKINIRFDPPDSGQMRIVIPLSDIDMPGSGDLVVCERLKDATHLCKIDYERGRVERSEDVPLTGKGGISAVGTILQAKLAEAVWTRAFCREDREVCETIGVRYVQVEGSEIDLFVPAIE
ncbi:MAG: cation transporter [Patescibacteria group bacterium]|nr:cation transporter [Patescibacteria group bacterium]